MEDETDIYNEIDPPKQLFAIGTVAVLVVFIVTTCIREDAAPLFAAFSAGVLCLLLGLTWQLRRRKMLWVILTGIGLLHVAAITMVRFPERISYGVLFAPLVCLDTYIFWKLTVSVLKVLD